MGEVGGRKQLPQGGMSLSLHRRAHHRGLRPDPCPEDAVQGTGANAPDRCQSGVIPGRAASSLLISPEASGRVSKLQELTFMDLGLEVNLSSKAFRFVSDSTVTRTLPSVREAMMVGGVSSSSM